jgi:O-antigen/teichoic acid export membrane protein
VTEPTPQAAHREFGRRFLGGLSWTAGAQLASQIVTFLAGVLLARLLAPSQFGVVAMAVVYTTFVGLLAEMGFTAAIVYFDDVTDADLCTMYWVNLGTNLLLFVAALFLAPLVGVFFHDPAVVPVVKVASLVLVVSALAGVQRTLLGKRMDFRRLARNRFAGSVAYAIASVVMALAGFGVWALVIGRIIEMGTDSALAAFTSDWRPKLAFSLVSLRRLLSYGGRVWAGNMLYYGQENIDNLVVGRVLGATPLGFYSLAFRVANVPRYFFSGVVGSVMFPSFSSGRGEPAVLKAMYLRICSYAMLIAVGLGTGLALVSQEFVHVVYGPKWLPAVPVMRVLAIAAGVYCVSQVVGPVLLALGRPGLQTSLLLGSSAVLLAGASVGVRWGIAGVAVAVLAAVTVAFGLGQVFVIRQLDIGLGEYRRAMTPPLAAITVMSIAVLAWHWLGQRVLGIGDATWLALAIALGAAALWVGLLAVRAPQVADVRSMVGALRVRLGSVAVEEDKPVA